MPQEPKKRHSRARQGKRRHAINLSNKTLVTCKNCGNKHVSHTICGVCGFYNGKPRVSKTDTQMKSQTPAKISKP